MSKTVVSLNSSPSFTAVSLNTSPSLTLVTLPTSITWLRSGFWESFNIHNWEDTIAVWNEAE
jgi:hypothetical protein|tara:strand:- start:1291 stop:1476 length:186 start_codon:yes stop_codon:yes gene_type:complete